MPLYIGDYLRDTLGLSRSEHGSYLLLIMAYWTNGGPLIDDDPMLREISKCPEIEWGRTKGLMLRFFRAENGHWIHNRIDEELQKTRDQYAKRIAQTEGALKSRGIEQKNATSDVTSNVTSDVTSNVTSDVTSNVTSDVTSMLTSRHHNHNHNHNYRHNHNQ